MFFIFIYIILFNSTDTETPDQISFVTVAVGDDGETYQIPNWTWDGMIELNYDNYKYVDMLNTVSNERVIEADFSLINKIKTKARELYGDIIGKLYTNDDLYTSCGKVIRKYTVIITDKITDEILLFKTFDAFADAQYFYENLLKI